MVNGGQVCVCPDYVFVPDDQMDSFVAPPAQPCAACSQASSPTATTARRSTTANFDRVVGLIEDARANGASVETIAPEGESLPDRASRKIAPTIVRDIDERMKIAGEEIFGPVLVVKGYSRLGDAIDYINQRPAPLVAYWYGPDDADFRRFVRSTRSGGVARNDFAAQMIPSGAPFGGVGRSGMGAYHGKAGFDAFSHHRYGGRQRSSVQPRRKCGTAVRELNAAVCQHHDAQSTEPHAAQAEEPARRLAAGAAASGVASAARRDPAGQHIPPRAGEASPP